MVGWRRVPAAASAGRLDAHAAARPRLLPPRADEPARRRHSLPRRPARSASSLPPSACRPRTSCSGSWRRCACPSGSRRRCAGATGPRSGPSVRSSPAPPASTTWATVATASPPAPSTTSASPCRATRSRDAAQAAALAGIGKSPRDYAPHPGNPRSLRRRNQILALMARNGSIPEALAELCQAEPLRVTARSPSQDRRPWRHRARLRRAGPSAGSSHFGIEDLFQGRISVRSTVDERVQVIANEALENGLALYEKRHPKAKGMIQGSVVASAQRGRGHPGRGRVGDKSTRIATRATPTSIA